MASGITHILLTKELPKHLGNTDLRMMLQAQRDYFQVGAVAPDLPYASVADNDFFLTTQSDLADLFHYTTTNQIPIRALDVLKGRRPDHPDAAFDRMFAFVLGYLSHVIADGIIHPFIRDMVGDYKDHQTDHRRLEMRLDVLYYDELTRPTNAALNVSYAHLHDELKNIADAPPAEVRPALELFSDLIFTVYAQRHDPDRILGWVTGLHRMFSLATSGFIRIYRGIDVIDGVTFADTADLIAKREQLLKLETPVDREENFVGWPVVHYFVDVIPRFFARFGPLAQGAYDYVYGSGPSVADRIPPIDLDTGRLLAANGNLDAVPTLWS